MLFVGLWLLGAGLWMLFRRTVVADSDRRLSERLRGIVDIVSVEADSDSPDDIEEELLDYLIGIPEGQLTQVRDASGRRVFPPLESGQLPFDWKSVGTEPLVGEVRSTSAHVYRLRAETVSIRDQEYRVLVASSLQSLEDTRSRLVTSLLIAIPSAVLLSILSGLYIARRALAPIEEVTRAASEITVGSLEKRIPVPGTGDALERLSRTFNEMMDRLEASVARLEQFSTDASHEMRTPVSVIRTTAELALRHGRTEEEYRSDLVQIEDEARRLGEIIDLLLSLARTGVTESVAFADVDLASLVSEVCAAFDRQGLTEGLPLSVAVPERPAMVRGHEPALRRLLLALLENARAHTERGGIGVLVVGEPDSFVLEVRDTGEGIPAESLDRVFDRFFRVDPARSRAEGRLGVGLSIAKRIAELHGAEIDVTSRVGVGSEFRVRFPRNGR
jgi:signal transduction histidine kinase